VSTIATDLALQMERVSKIYHVGDGDVKALDHVDLTICADEIIALVGPSGSGKTTLCAIAGGLLTPTDGHRRRTGHLPLQLQGAHAIPARVRRLRLSNRQPRAVPDRTREPAGGG
jgi:putative ABC transport system ATP-binding protein